MDITQLILTLGPTVTSLLSSLGNAFRTPSAPTPDTKVPVPNEAIKHLQTMLNVALALIPPLKVDGWLGPKTDAAIEAAIVKLHGMGIG